MSLEDKVAELTATVQRMETERAILATLHRYGHSIDYGDETSWLDCFTPDGAFDLHIKRDGEARGRARGFGEPHGQGVRFAGRAVLEQFIKQHTRAPAVWHKHFMVEPVITLGPDGKSAHVRSYFVMLDEPAATPAMRAFGRYVDTMTLSSDGRWRFKERIAEIESMRD